MKQITSLLMAILFFTGLINAQNVGIGTITPPLLRLHVSSITDSNLLLLENRNPLGLQQLTSMYFRTGSYYTGAIKTIGASANEARIGFFTFSSSNINGLSERMSILDNGNVGINTTTPSADFDVNGTIRIRGNAAAGKVLTSDASGNATWQTPVTSNGIGFSAYLAASLPLADGVTTNITGYTEDFDDVNVFTPSNGRFIAPSAGVYQISYNLNFLESGTATKYLNIDINVNGGTRNTYYYVISGLNSNAGATYTNSLILKLAQSDYVSLALTRQQTGGSTLRGGNFTGSTYFSAHKVY